MQGAGGDNSGKINASGDIGSVTILGNLTGGGGLGSGNVFTAGKLASLTIGGTVQGGAGDRSGRIHVAGNAGTITISGDLIGGSVTGVAALEESGFISAKRIASLQLRGSLLAGIDGTSGLFENNGAICVSDDIGALLIKGSIIGNSTNSALISARGQFAPTATTDVAIGSMTVRGRVEFGLIEAGIDFNSTTKNADAQIGAVIVQRRLDRLQHRGRRLARRMVSSAMPTT